MLNIFKKIYETNYWAGRQSRSGSGSDLEETKNIRKELPKALRRLKVKSLVDIPCGDFNWFPHADWPEKMQYYGYDIVEAIIEHNKIEWPTLHYGVGDITKDNLPKADAILTRDCLGHLSNVKVHMAVENIKRAKPKYFITTHWPGAEFKDIIDGDWRKINMEHYLGDSFELIELIDEDINGKTLAVYAMINSERI